MFGTGRNGGYRNITSPIVMQINAKDKHVMFHGQTNVTSLLENGEVQKCDNTTCTCTYIVIMLNSIMKEMNLEMT